MNSNLVKANDLYRRSQQNNGLSKVLKESCLEKAIKIYQQEITNVTDDCRSSLMRNLGMANLKLAEFLDPKYDLDLVVFYLAQAVESLTNALTLRPNDVNTVWGERLQERILECFEKAFQSGILFYCYSCIF